MIHYEFPQFTQDGEPFIPTIFDAGPGEDAPAGFNALRIPLDGRLTSDLSWTSAWKDAARARERGLKILWDLDLGLFSRLSLPLSDQTQFRSLALAAQHLVDRLRTDFTDSTVGVVLYRGSVKLPDRMACLGYLKQLTADWPDAIPRLLMFDASFVDDPVDVLLMTHRVTLDPFAIAIRGSPLPGRTLGWEQPSTIGAISRRPLPPEPQLTTNLGLCLPAALSPAGRQRLGEALKWFNTQAVPFRVIAEDHLTADWDGLDYLLVPDTPSTHGRRQLQGFCAAGGTVVSLGNPLSLPLEISFEAYATHRANSSI